MDAHRPLAAWLSVILIALVSCAATDARGGPWFSDELLAPRLGQPALREAGESFAALVALTGSYTVGQVAASLTGSDGSAWPLTTVSVTAQPVVAGNELDVMLYATGIATVQEVVLSVPAGTPADLYSIAIDVDGTEYASVSAVRVYDAYPSSWGFLHATDLHVGYDGSEYSSLERLQAFVREADFLNPEIVVVSGDICDNQLAGHDWPAQALGALAVLRVPVYLVPGNHDYYNDGEDYDPSGPHRYFTEINPFENSVVELGGARFYGVTTQYDHGLFQLYRCHGPSTEGLAWVQADAAGLGASDLPRFLLMHGPNYDRYTWNTTNTTAVRDLMSGGGFALALAGHTHRYETYLNSGSNSLGRDDFDAGDDWGQDVAFPGYPLHIQTSALGKAQGEDAAGQSEPADERGPYGSRVSWRWVQVDGTDVSFFTADTDGDGYRSTETPWDLGLLSFAVVADTAGVITSSVQNQHRETWYGVRHHVPADPGVEYEVEGGTLVRRMQDGTAVVAVTSVGPLATSVVVLTPGGHGRREPGARGSVVARDPEPVQPRDADRIRNPERLRRAP